VTALTDPSELASELDMQTRMMQADIASYLVDDILTKVDRASMAVSLEAREPLLDSRLAELAFRLPLSMKIRDGERKWALRRVLERRVPRALFERPKMGFGVPLAEWLRGPLRPWAESLLAPDRIARSDLEEVVVTNTIPLKASARSNEKITQLSVAPLLAEAIKRVHYKQSVSDLFKRDKDKKEHA
jgi:asparagine synthetase B (glutamine-hydrolysing)